MSSSKLKGTKFCYGKDCNKEVDISLFYKSGGKLCKNCKTKKQSDRYFEKEKSRGLFF